MGESNLNLDYIADKLKNRSSKPLDIKYCYGVLLPIIDRNNRLELLYEVRAKNLKRQPGEISFPGGEVEDSETFEEASIRETCEELNIKRENISVIGKLDYLISYSNISLHPYVGILQGIDVDRLDYSKDEVDHVFTVPLDFFLENEPSVSYADILAFAHENFPYDMIPGGKEYDWKKGKYSVYFYKYNKYVIWGLTAKITKNFIDIIKESC